MRLAVDLEIAAENAGQDEHRRSSDPARPRPAARDAVDDSPAHESGPISRNPCGCVVTQRADDRLGRALVAEVVEVRDLAALIEHEGRARVARGVPPYIERVCTTRSLSVQ